MNYDVFFKIIFIYELLLLYNIGTALLFTESDHLARLTDSFGSQTVHSFLFLSLNGEICGICIYIYILNIRNRDLYLLNQAMNEVSTLATSIEK